MKKALFVLASIIPGIVFAKGTDGQTKVRITMQTPEEAQVANYIIQESGMVMGVDSGSVSLINEQNAVEVKVTDTASADELTANLKEILGIQIIIEKVSPDDMRLGTQDDVMKP